MKKMFLSPELGLRKLPLLYNMKSGEGHQLSCEGRQEGDSHRFSSGSLPESPFQSPSPALWRESRPYTWKLMNVLYPSICIHFYDLIIFYLAGVQTQSSLIYFVLYSIEKEKSKTKHEIAVCMGPIFNFL